MGKLDIIKDIMKEQSVNAWILYSDEKSNPIFCKYISNHTIVASCAVVTQEEIFLIVHELEIDNIDKTKFTVFTFGQNKSFEQALYEILSEKLFFCDKLFLDFSTKNDSHTDLLGHGIYCYLTDTIKKLYDQNGKAVAFLSSENILYSLFDRKSTLTIKRMQKAADIALDIIEKAFKQLHEHLTEKEIVNIVHNIFEETCNQEIGDEICKIEYSWQKEFCPIVLVGPSLIKGGHALASEQLLERGHTVYFDFGVMITYYDKEQVSSDLQRMGYFLKVGEVVPPIEVTKVFETLIQSINLGIEKIRPNMKGFELDAIVRSVILTQGYPDYNHATGHSIGEKAHNLGASLGKKEGKLSNLDIQENGVYTIEPRISINNGGSIEEMVLVTKDGGIALSKRQTNIYLID